MANARIKLKVIPKPEPNTRSVFLTDNKELDSFFDFQTGKVDFICGNCKRVLIKNSDLARQQNLVLQCPGCGEYNQC